MPDHPRRQIYRHKLARTGAVAIIIALSFGPDTGKAQLLGVPLPNVGGALPRLPQIPDTLGAVDRTVRQTTGALTSGLRDAVGRPQQTAAFGQDQNGARVVRDEVLALAPTEESLAAARSLGFEITRNDTMQGLGLRVVTLRPPRNMAAGDALEALRRTDPDGTYDYNHIYNPSGDLVPAGPLSLNSSGAAPGISIGLVDAGIDLRHPALRNAHIVAANVATSSEAPATAHGTAIASLLVGDSGSYRGVLAGATLYAADIYGGAATGGSASAVVRGLAWVAAKNVAVINVSLAGPPNRLLETAIRTLTAQGHVIVAAVGNDGPATPVSYPAGYDGVIAVTSVDATRAVQIDANRGPQVAFAALGVKVKVATLENGYGPVTGTSFAAPLVAARFAVAMPRPNADEAARVARMLESETEDLGPPGRDTIFGYGFLDSSSPTDQRLAGPR